MLGLTDDIQELESENKLLRKLLWYRHGCELSALYGDDGEMQCNKCGIDFKRLNPIEIERSFIRSSLKNHPELLKSFNALANNNPVKTKTQAGNKPLEEKDGETGADE